MRTANWKKRLSISTALVALMAAAPAQAQIVPGSVLKANWGGFPESWAIGQDVDMGYYRVPYENLLTVDERDEPQPWLATSWELDNEGITLHLRDDVVFHDGENFDAEAVKANIEGVRDTPGPFGGSFQVVESIDVLDTYSLRVNFRHPVPAFPTLLASRNLPIISPAAIATDNASTPVGTGPWAYDASASSAGTRMTFVSFADYWGERPAFDTVELYGIENRAAEVAALGTGEIDITDFEYEFIPQIDADPTLEWMMYPSVRNAIVFFERGPGGAFENIDVRRAICSALDREEVIRALGEEETYSITSQHLLEDTFAYNPDIVQYPFDLDAANRYIEAAGSPSVTGSLIAAPFMADRANIYAQQIGRVPGVTINVQEASTPQYQSEWNTGAYSLGIGGHDELTPYDWYANWFAANGSANPAGVESEELKALADAAVAAGDSPEAEGLWMEVIQQINDEALACAYLQSSELIAYRVDRLENVEAPIHPFEGSATNYWSIRPLD